MTVEVVAPVEFQSSVIGGVTSRRGTILDSEVHDDEFTVTAEVALNDMFGYSSQLRGQTQGKVHDGVQDASGDTFMDGATKYSMTSVFVPEPLLPSPLVVHFSQRSF
ncbi:hypothetical protein DFH11DRAFT_1815249 [Phellopilus nigrolimitatus]|nr:hypothetical protein DFH11DRAFT_1815249 [Phellopilus nigrolimitatus]